MLANLYVSSLTYVMKPRDLVLLGVGANLAFEVDVVSFFDVLRI